MKDVRIDLEQIFIIQPKTFEDLLFLPYENNYKIEIMYVHIPVKIDQQLPGGWVYATNFGGKYTYKK